MMEIIRAQFFDGNGRLGIGGAHSFVAPVTLVAEVPEISR